MVSCPRGLWCLLGKQVWVAKATASSNPAFTVIKSYSFIPLGGCQVKGSHFSSWIGAISFSLLSLYSLFYLTALADKTDYDDLSTYVIIATALSSILFSVWGYIKSKTIFSKATFWVVMSALILLVLAIVALAVILSGITYE
jgi:hypothetical protein